MKSIKQVWAVYSTNDEYGRFDEVDDLRGVYENKAAAEKAADGVGWYGGAGEVTERTAVRSNGKWWLTVLPFSVELNTPHVSPMKSLRKKALSKLTKVERKLLGLED